MRVLILSGVGGSTNWLPLIFPLVVIVLILTGADLLNKFQKKRKLHRENKVVEHFDENGNMIQATGDGLNGN